MSGIQCSIQQPSLYLGKPLSIPTSNAVPPASSAPTSSLSADAFNPNSDSSNAAAWVIGPTVGMALLAVVVGSTGYALSDKSSTKGQKPASTKILARQTGTKHPFSLRSKQSTSSPPLGGKPYILKYRVEPHQQAKQLAGPKNVFDSVSDDVTKEGISFGALFDAYQQDGVDLYDTVQGPDKPKSKTGKNKLINVTSPQWANEAPPSPGRTVWAVSHKGAVLLAEVTAWWEPISDALDTHIINVRTRHEIDRDDRLNQQTAFTPAPFLSRNTLPYWDEGHRAVSEKVVPLLTKAQTKPRYNSILV